MGEEEVKMDLTGSEVIPPNQGGLLIMGSGSSGAQFLTIDDQGQLVTTAAAYSGSIEVTGSVLVENFPAIQAITGTVALEGGEVTIGNFPDVQTVTGTVDITSIASPIVIGNFPVTQGVRLVDEPIQVFFDLPVDVTGTVDATITNFPSLQTVTGTIDILNPVDVNILNDLQVNVTGNTDQGLAGTVPQSWFVSLTDGSQVIGDSSAAPVFTSGSVHIQNLPAVQAITGTVALEGGEVTIGNFPAVQTVTGSAFVFGDFFQATQPVSFVQPIEVFGTASVVVSSLPSITGTVGVTSIASPVEVEGTFWQAEQPVSVSNFPESQVVTGIVDILNPVAVEGTFWQATQPITGVVEINNPLLTVGGTISVTNLPTTQSVVYPLAPTATRSSVTASVVTTQILAVNPDRKGVMLYVSSAGEDVACYVGFGSGPLTTGDASFILYSDDAYTLEQPFVTAPIQSIFNLHTGSVRLFVTEID